MCPSLALSLGTAQVSLKASMDHICTAHAEVLSVHSSPCNLPTHYMGPQLQKNFALLRLLSQLFLGSAGVMWKGFETYSQISLRNIFLVSSDWVRTKVFGRDISKV